MGSFLDGFADGFTNSFNAMSSRKSDKERTALGYESLEEERRHAEETEAAERERIRLAEEGLKIDQGNLDIAKSAETRAQEEAPGIQAEREANTRRLAAAAAIDEYKQSPEGLAEIERERQSEIELRGAQTEQAIAEAGLTAEKTVEAKYKNTDAFRAKVEDAMAAEAEANRGAGAQAQAQARKIGEEASTLVMGNAPGVQRMVRTLNATGMFPFEVTTDHVLYMNEHGGHMPPNPETYTYSPSEEEGAIPEGEAAVEKAAEGATEPEPDPDALDEPAPGENPDEPYRGDTPPANAPIPAPSAPPPTEPASAGETPVARTPQPRPEPSGATSATAASTGRTLQDYERMSDDEFFGLSHEERQNYDRLKATAGPIDKLTGRRGVTAGTAISDPVTGETLSNWNTAGDGALPIDARTPRPRPERPEAALPEGTSGVTPVSYRAGEAAGAGAAGRVIEAQAGTRSKPLNTKTRSMMETAAAQTGVTVRVTSGAQDSSGPNRTGSHRHDSDVGAGDIQLIDEATGKPVSMKTPEGRAKMIQFMQAARAAGATGFGAGLDYMGDTTIHVGFGDPGVWGAGGKGANAPKWLKDGMNMGAGPSSQPQGTGSRPAGVARAYQLLQKYDVPQMQAAVLAGNIQQESSGDPNAFNEKEGAKGIIQWRQDRLDKLNQFASAEGTDPNSLETQVAFLIQEGERLGSEQDKAAWQEFMAATTPEEANAALKKFIRYGDESAGTRLEYANNLLASGGAEIKGEKGSAIPVQGEGGERRVRLPTPRGEAKRNVIRSNIVKGGREAGVVGAKAAVQNAGLITAPSAVPTVDKQAAQKAYVTGDPKAGKTVAKIREVAQKTLPPGTKVSDAEMNLYMYNLSYQHALEHGTKEQAEAIMGEMHQAYRAMHNEYVAFAQSLASNNRTDDAVKTFIKSQTFIPDGMEATASKDANGDFIISIRDMETDEIVEQVVRTPAEVTADILGWNPSTNLDRQMMRAAGKTPRSLASEAGQQQLAQPIESPTGVSSLSNPSAEFTRQAIPTALPIDPTGIDPAEQFTNEEQNSYTSGLAQRNTRIDEANKAAQPPANVDRAAIRAEIAALEETVSASETDAKGNLVPGTIGHSYELLKNTYGNNLNSILTNVLQTNPGEIAETVVTDIANALSASNPEGGADRLPMQASRGDYEGTWKLNFVGSPTTYNVPSETAMAIRNGIMEKMQTEQEGFGKKFFEYARDKPRIDEENARARAAETRDETVTRESLEERRSGYQRWRAGVQPAVP